MLKCFPGITILLSLTVFSLLVADLLPKTSDAIPLLGTFTNSWKKRNTKYTLNTALFLILFCTQCIFKNQTAI